MDQIKARCNRLIGVISEDKEVIKATNKILELTKPKIWNTHIEGNADVEMAREYERTLLVMQEHTTQDLNNISVHKFYSLVAFIKEKQRPDAR